MRACLSILLAVCAVFNIACATGPKLDVTPQPVGDNWAQVTWTTPQDGNSIVQFGTTREYSQIATDDNLYTKHRVTLYNLKPETRYHYRVLSFDGSSTITSRDCTFKTGPATIGCEVNVTGEPMGGGAGYSQMIKREQATKIVANTNDFLDALKTARPGDIIYIGDKAVIDVSGMENVIILGGVTLASGRGQAGSVGGLIKSTSYVPGNHDPVFKTGGKGVRITGLRFAGPSNAFGRVLPMYHGIYAAHYWTEIDNCEFWGWNYEAINTTSGTKGLYVHHNYFHHNTRIGCGYGISTDEGVALIEGNLFDYHRHSIASTGPEPSGYEARYNLVMEHSISHAFDMHGAADFEKAINKIIYRFDEAAGAFTADTSEYGHNNPTLHGFEPATCWVEGYINYSLQFDGMKDWVDGGPGYRNNLGTPIFSTMAWIKPADIYATQAIVSKASTTPTGAGYSLRLVGPGVEAAVYDSTGARVSKTTGTIAPGQWTHVALTFDGSIARVYINGKESASFAAGGVRQSTTSRYIVGRDSETATSFFKGNIDEVRHYSVAMPAADIARIAGGGADVAGTEIRIHHNTCRILDRGSVNIRGIPSVGVWINNNWFYRDKDSWNIRQLNAKGKFHLSDNNQFGPKDEKPAGHAPTLTCVDHEIKTGGDIPGGFYRFRVKYTDPDNDPPMAGYPRLILKRNGEVFSYLTPLTMMPLDLNKFSKGRTYMCELALPRGTDYSYSFEAMDTPGNKAVGEATKDFAGPAVTSGNTAPILYPHMGHPSFVENWIYPSNGDPNTVFDCRITYLDIDNDAPEGGAPKVRITDAQGAEIAGSPFAMSPLTNVQDANGRIYQLRTKLPVGTFKCELIAKDSQGAPAMNLRPATLTVRPAGAKSVLTPLTQFD